MSIRIIEQSKECFTIYKSTPNFTLVFRWLSIQYFILHFSKIERWQYERDMIKYLTFCTNENLRFFLWFRWCVWHKRSWWIHLTKWKLINYKQKIFLRKMYDIEYKTSFLDKVWYMYRSKNSSTSLPSTLLSYLLIFKVFSSFRYLDLFKNTKYSFTF